MHKCIRIYDKLWPHPFSGTTPLCDPQFRVLTFAAGCHTPETVILKDFCEYFAKIADSLSDMTSVKEWRKKARDTGVKPQEALLGGNVFCFAESAFPSILAICNMVL